MLRLCLPSLSGYATYIYVVRITKGPAQGFATGKKLVYQFTPNRKTAELSNGEVALAGAFSAIPQTAVAAPMERIKVVLQSQGENPKYKGPLDVVGKLYAEGGVRSIFRGTFATLARDVPGSAAYFAAYELSKKSLTPAGQEASFLQILTAGGIAGMCMGSFGELKRCLLKMDCSLPRNSYTT